MKIGIYGGTFDPPHIGHINILKCFCRQFSLDEVYVIPACIPPHKTVNSGVKPTDRFDMAVLAFSGISEKIVVSDIEMRREGKSYTSDTIKYFREKSGEAPYFLCGTDMFLTLDTWHEPEYIMKNSVVVCARRENDPKNDALIAEKELEYRKKYGAIVHKLDCAVIQVSSTDVRKAISNAYKTNDFSNAFVTDEVMKYILKNNLYREGNIND